MPEYSITNNNMAFKSPNNVIATPLRIGLPTVQDPVTTTVSVASNQNSFSQFYVQNKSTGDTASTDLILGADNDIAAIAGHYANLGMCGSGFIATTAANGIVRTVSVTAGGTGYTVGDILTLATGDANAQVSVLTAPSGIVGTVQILDNGTNYTTGTKSTTGGTGTGCTINVLSLFDFSAQSANGTYLFSVGGELLIGTDETVANKPIRFVVSGESTGDEKVRIDQTGMIVMPVTAVPAGGTAATGLRFSSTANLGIFFGSGVPTLSAAQGSLYMRTDGSTTSTRMYINTNGTTGWTAVTTAS